MKRSHAKRSQLSAFLFLVILNSLGTKPQIVECYAHNTAQYGEIADPLSRTFPKPDDPGNARIFGQPAIRFRVGGIVQYIDDAGAANTRRIIDACLLEAVVLAKLLCARLCQ